MDCGKVKVQHQHAKNDLWILEKTHNHLDKRASAGRGGLATRPMLNTFPKFWHNLLANDSWLKDRSSMSSSCVAVGLSLLCPI